MATNLILRRTVMGRTYNVSPILRMESFLSVAVSQIYSLEHGLLTDNDS